MINILRSLTDILGADYMAAVKECAVKLYGMPSDTAENLAGEPVEFFGGNYQTHQDELLEYVGSQFVAPFINNNTGAPTIAYAKASNLKAAPIGGLGIFRVGEDGRLYLAAKSEHYHISLGHSFHGYRLIDRARMLGIPNATHNNTRGFITRLMEREIISNVNGLKRGDDSALDAVLQSAEPKVLNRLVNLETGSIAVEAGIKMMLKRFYRLDGTNGMPARSGKTPVFLVMADNEGGIEANYHGTTMMAQMMRGLWPDLNRAAEKKGLYKVVGVKINDASDFEQKIRKYNRGRYRTAGFLHEIILMNYGGIRLTEEYLQAAYRLCRQYDTPTMVDEIQSCMWYKGMLLYKLYGLNPDFVVLGKGFPGGEYPASKIITTMEMDSLNQFGALVTNGQEELASLSYLVTMEFAQANGDEIERLGAYFESRMKELAAHYPSTISKIEGKGHLSAIHFKTVEIAVRFSKIMNDSCIDVSAQTYKAKCPPAALMKLPLTTSEKAMDYLVGKMSQAMGSLSGQH